jgi:hypothetical protein
MSSGTGSATSQKVGMAFQYCNGNGLTRILVLVQAPVRRGYIFFKNGSLVIFGTNFRDYLICCRVLP